MVRTIIEETGDGKIKLVVGNFNAEVSFIKKFKSY